jgi:uncharacterized protein YdaU (DUF1376 family)
MTGLWWWIDRWRTSAAFREMTLEEQGAYRNLLDEASLNGGVLSRDERVLAKACGDATRWPEVRPNVLKKFYLTPEGWRNPALDGVLHETQRRQAKQAAYRAGHGGRGNATGNDRGNAAGNARGNKRGNGAGNKP